MLTIEKNVPVPPRYTGRKSKQRDSVLAAMKDMQPGDSFRTEYKLASMRNFIRTCGIEGSFRAAQEGETTIRVWRLT
jgi:hypothetical protein